MQGMIQNLLSYPKLRNKEIQSFVNSNLLFNPCNCFFSLCLDCDVTFGLLNEAAEIIEDVGDEDLNNFLWDFLSKDFTSLCFRIETGLSS